MMLFETSVRKKTFFKEFDIYTLVFVKGDLTGTDKHLLSSQRVASPTFSFNNNNH